MPDGAVGATNKPQGYRLVEAGAGDLARKFDSGFRYGPDNAISQGAPPGAAGAVLSNAFEPEDEYQKLYVGGVNSRGLLEPPYSLRGLDRLSQENNTLSPCVEAMVSNIDGTGYVFEKIDDTTLDESNTDPHVKALKAFFDEPWPGETFISIRKAVRRDVERVGNGYMEWVRNPKDEIVFCRHVDGKMVRIVKLDAPTVAVKTVFRLGVEVSVKMQIRERRFAQLLNGRALMFFKEFGASRDLDKITGEWAPRGERLPANRRASELMHFIALPDAHTPYGVPRWVGQMPSVLGSRKAEEFNMDFFDNGGVPPLLIMLMGGALATETRKALENGLHAGAKRANRTQIIEVDPTGGSLDQNATARVLVERFGHDRQQDSMFEKYDDKCELRVRRGFRLPPIFLGNAQDASFATAYASYVVAEAQVFKPEREDFDSQITLKVLPVMKHRGYRLRSRAMQINDSAKQLQGIELAGKTDRVEPGEIVRMVNEVMGLNLNISAIPVIGFGEALATLTLTAPGSNTNPSAPNTPQNILTSPSKGPSTKPTQSPTTGNPSPSGKQTKVGKEEHVVNALALGVYEDIKITGGVGLEDDDEDRDNHSDKAVNTG